MKKVVKNVNVNVNENVINEKEQEKLLKKQEQNKRIWLSCESKGHFGCMVPKRYLDRDGVKEKLLCPVCGKQLKYKNEMETEIIEMAANK